MSLRASPAERPSILRRRSSASSNRDDVASPAQLDQASRRWVDVGRGIAASSPSVPLVLYPTASRAAEQDTAVAFIVTCSW